MAGSVRSTINFEAAREWMINRGMQAIGKGAQHMAHLAEIYAPKDTHYMSQNIIVTPTAEGFAVIVLAYYAKFVEFGHMSVAGNWVPPQPFFRLSRDDTIRDFPSLVTTT